VTSQAIGYGDIYTGELFMGYPADGLLEYANGLRQAPHLGWALAPEDAGLSTRPLRRAR
jgi:hypothetical protein